MRTLTGTLFGLSMFLWTAPVLLAAPQVLQHHLHEHHFRWHPLWEWLGQPDTSLPFLVGVNLTLVALAVAALSRRRPSDVTDPVPAS